MTQTTPGMEAAHAKLGPLQSRYVEVDALPWQPTRWPGIETKTLMIDPATGFQTVLTRMAPGTVLTDHMHVNIEQTWVIEGRLVDDEGEARAGNFVWRPKGSRHVASAPDGAVLLGIFLEPNTFF